MTSKEKTIFVCSSCGFHSHKWQGRCFECGEYNTFVQKKQKVSRRERIVSTESVQLTTLEQVSSNTKTRIKTGFSELDQILAGGFVPCQVLLLGGEPGIGKSTLLLQIAENFNTIYVCGEESESQVKRRAERLKINSKKITLLRHQEINTIIQLLEDRYNENTSQNQTSKSLVVVDSIQSVFSTHINSGPGSISQVQFCTNSLVGVAKKYDISLVITGQVTKGGYLAGPKQLEHIVDTVLYMEGDKRTDLRILRITKNRFGPTDGVGMFNMTEKGLIQAGELIRELIENREADVPGSVLSVVIEGNRPILLEVQALNAPAQYGNARRVVTGVSLSRVLMLLAVLARRVGIKTQNYDIYVNLSGGFKVLDTALDLPIALAIASVVKNKPLPVDLVAFGEVGLLGEVKAVPYQEKRRAEAKKFGYKKIVDVDFSSHLAVCMKKIPHLS